MIRRVIMKFTFGEFKSNKQGAYILIAAEDIVGFCKKGCGLYGNCDSMVVVDFRYDALSEIYTVFLANVDNAAI